MKRFVAFAALALGAAVGLTACPSSGGNSSGPIKIGVAGPMSGGQKKQGDDVKNAVLLAIKEWNEKGGVLGRQIEMVERDDEAKESRAVDAARQLASAGVAGVIGHFNSGCTIPASDIYREANIVMITPSATNPKVTDRGYPNVFRVCGRDDMQGGVAAKFVLDKIKPKKVAILHDKTTYGQGLAEEFKKGIEAAGVQVVRFDGISQDETDYKAVLSSVKGAEPDVWYYGGMYDKGAPITVQARDVGITVPLVSGDGLKEPEFLSKAGTKAEPAYMTFGPDPNAIPTAKAFLEKYKKAYNMEEGPYSIYAYDAANILLGGIKAAGNTDGAKIAEEIRKAKHDGALGTLSFDKKGDLAGNFYVVWEVTKGAQGFQVSWNPGN